jgi:hypothetical protein
MYTQILAFVLASAATTNFTVGSTPISVAAGDFTGDGKADSATANYYSNNVPVLPNTSFPARPPQAEDDYPRTTESINIPVSSLLANDTDPDGGSLRVTSVSNRSRYGGVSLKDNRTPTDYSDDYVAFTPTKGTASYLIVLGKFDYTITNRKGGTASATVVILNSSRNVSF